MMKHKEEQRGELPMKNRIKELFAGKKRILAVIISIVCICALTGGIFFTNQRLMERKKAEEQKIAKEKEQEAEKKEQEAEKKEAEKNAEKAEERPKEKKGPWTDYAAFIEDVKRAQKIIFRIYLRRNWISVLFSEEKKRIWEHMFLAIIWRIWILTAWTNCFSV